ncbi:hypothetical protein Tco_1516877 [Tanacetum coccineum]
METIHVKFDELIAMASEHDCLEPVLQRFNNNTSSVDTMNTPSKEDLDNLFDSLSTSSIIVENHEAPPIKTTSDEQTSPISLTDADEYHPLDQVIGDPSKPIMTRQKLQTDSELFEEDYKFEKLFHDLKGKNVICFNGSRKNKCDVKNIVVSKNKTRLVAKGYRQEKALFEESFASVSRL